jgi:hypothetical protein
MVEGEISGVGAEAVGGGSGAAESNPFKYHPECMNVSLPPLCSSSPDTLTEGGEATPLDSGAGVVEGCIARVDADVVGGSHPA